ncbi:MAG: hypothetical protein ACI4HI_14035 [Lachnospiraceae bacterium]
MNNEKQTQNTAYDDVFRTLLNDCTRLIIPVINEVFHTTYALDDEIQLLNNELYTAGANKKTGRRSKKRETDSQIQFANLGKHLFHIECQSTKDGTMIVRMFEYDTAIAINKSRMEGNTLVIDYPKSAVMYLREQTDMPDVLDIRIRTSEGEIHHHVPVIKTQVYSVSDIFEKQLYFLIPFYLFHYEREFDELEHNPQKRQRLHDDYMEILEKLDQAYEKEKTISFLEKNTLKDLCRAVAKRLTEGKYEEIEEEVNTIMGGKILEYETKTAYNKGWKDGEERGEEKGEKRGEKKHARLMKALLKDGRMEELELALDNPEILSKLYKEYQI